MLPSAAVIIGDSQTYDACRVCAEPRSSTMDTQIVAGSGLRRACTPATVPTVPKSPQPPRWVKPQLTRLVDEAPAGSDWLHEIKYDGYRMHARIDGDKIQLLTRTGLDWSRGVRPPAGRDRLGPRKPRGWRLSGLPLCGVPARIVATTGQSIMSQLSHAVLATTVS